MFILIGRNFDDFTISFSRQRINPVSNWVTRVCFNVAWSVYSCLFLCYSTPSKSWFCSFNNLGPESLLGHMLRCKTKISCFTRTRLVLLDNFISRSAIWKISKNCGLAKTLLTTAALLNLVQTPFVYLLQFLILGKEMNLMAFMGIFIVLSAVFLYTVNKKKSSLSFVHLFVPVAKLSYFSSCINSFVLGRGWFYLIILSLSQLFGKLVQDGGLALLNLVQLHLCICFNYWSWGIKWI